MKTIVFYAITFAFIDASFADEVSKPVPIPAEKPSSSKLMIQLSPEETQAILLEVLGQVEEQLKILNKAKVNPRPVKFSLVGAKKKFKPHQKMDRPCSLFSETVIFNACATDWHKAKIFYPGSSKILYSDGTQATLHITRTKDNYRNTGKAADLMHLGSEFDISVQLAHPDRGTDLSKWPR